MNKSIFDLLHTAMSKYPQLRVCQIIMIASKLGGWENNDVFYVPDATLADGLEKLINKETIFI